MTTMTRWQPFGEFADLHERLDLQFIRRERSFGLFSRSLQPSYLVPPFEQSRAIGRRS